MVSNRQTGHAKACGGPDVEFVAVVAIAAAGSQYECRHRYENTYPLGINTCYYSIPLVTFSNRIVVYAKFLCDQVNDSSLLGTEGPGERKLVAHAIVLEKQNPRVDL